VSARPSDPAGEPTSESTADIDGLNCNMDIRISLDAVVSADRSFVVFDAHVGERSVQCSIVREALEQYFGRPWEQAMLSCSSRTPKVENGLRQ
jgi:hypothetical protein